MDVVVTEQTILRIEHIAVRKRMGNHVKKDKKKRLMDLRGAECERCHCPLHLEGEYPDWPGSKEAHAHHIVSRWAGGTDKDENLLLTCRDCEEEYHQENPEHLFIGTKLAMFDEYGILKETIKGETK